MTARRRGFAGQIEQMFDVARRRAGEAEADRSFAPRRSGVRQSSSSSGTESSSR